MKKYIICVTCLFIGVIATSLWLTIGASTNEIVTLNEEPKCLLYNFKTKKYKYNIAPINDYSAFIPQDDISQKLYKMYVVLGRPPKSAAIKVLIIHLNIHINLPADSADNYKIRKEEGVHEEKISI